MRLKQFIGISMLLGVVCTALPASAQENGEWVQNSKDFPQTSIITKVRLKKNGGSGGFWKTVTLEGLDGSKYVINAKKLSVDNVKFKEMEKDTDGWGVYTLPVPSALYRWNNYCYDELCYTNIQFFVDEKLTAAEQTWVSASSKNLKLGTVITKVRINPEGNDCLNVLLFDGEETFANIQDGTIESNDLTTEEKVGSWVVYTFKKPVGLIAIFNEEHSSGGVQFCIDNDAKYVFNPFDVITDKEPSVTGPDGATMHHTTYTYRGNPMGFLRNSFFYIYEFFSTYKREKENLYLDETKYRDLNVSGYLLGDRLYEKNENGSLRVTRQIVDCLPLPVVEGDSITGIRKTLNHISENIEHIRFNLTYASGDSLSFDIDGSSLLVSGRVHRNGAVWTIENGVLQKIEYDNGDVYTGNVKNDELPWYKIETLSNHDAWKVRYDNGTLQKRNGTTIEYINGKTNQDIAAEKAKQAAEEARRNKAYQDLCKKYGKTYVDAARQDQIIPGMPEELMLKHTSFVFEVDYHSENSKRYRVVGIWGIRTDRASGHIWVQNGKVTSVTVYK